MCYDWLANVVTVEVVQMITVDPRELKALERDLWLLSTKAAPYANTNALNSLAFQAQQGGRANIRHGFINRNPFTERSVQVDKARLAPAGRNYSTVGSIAPYMERQEFGGTRVKSGKHGVPIPTKDASGEGEGGGPRKKKVRANRLLGAMTRVAQVRGGRTRAQQNAIQIRAARATGRNKVIYMELGRRKGLFRIEGRGERPRIRMVYDLSNTSVRIPKHPWLWPAVRFASMKGPDFYVKELEKQIARQKLFRSKR